MCEHFEGVLKVMGLLKALVMKVPQLASESRTVGMFGAIGAPWGGCWYLLGCYWWCNFSWGANGGAIAIGGVI